MDAAGSGPAQEGREGGREIETYTQREKECLKVAGGWSADL